MGVNCNIIHYFINYAIIVIMCIYYHDANTPWATDTWLALLEDNLQM